MTTPIALPIALYERQRIIEASDCDTLGHVNNAVWVRFLADLAEAHVAELGLDHARTAALGGAWVARTHQVFYLAEAWPGQVITEQTWVSQLKGPRCLRHYRFLNAEAECLFRGDSEWIFVDAKTHRPKRIPADIEQAFSLLPGDSLSGPQPA